MLYHNGITIVADQVDSSTAGKITVSGAVVVNGCQSLTALWDNQKFVSNDLRIMTRLIEVARASPIMGKITRNSNNQNGIQARDFQSNNAIQLRLRNEFTQKFGDTIFYRISRGEEPANLHSEVIDNEKAARLLLSFDLREPWSSHQTYRLFDDLHPRIFARPEVTAARILALNDIYAVVEQKLGSLQHELFAKYALARYFLIYLVARVLEGDPTGREFLAEPELFINASDGRNRLKAAVGEVLNDLIVDLNAEIDDRQADGKYFDFKQDLKSVTAVRQLANDTLTGYQKAVARNRAPSFSSLWNDSALS